MPTSKLVSDSFVENMTWGEGCPPITLTLKKGTRSSSRTYDYPCRKNLIHPWGITHNPCAEGCRGVVIFKDKICRPFNYIDLNGYLKILIRCVLELMGVGGGACCTLIIFDY